MIDKKTTFAKRGSTHFLRATIFIVGALVLILCAFALPAIYRGWRREYPEMAYLLYPVLLALTATIIPFCIALYQALRILNVIDENKAFSEVSVQALKNIKYCGLVIGGLYALGLPVIHQVAQHVDAPGVMVIGLFFACAPVVIAVFAAVIQKLLQSAIDLKAENDLTV